VVADFRALPFSDNTFPVVVFDPPHLERVGDEAWMGKNTVGSTKTPGATTCALGLLRLSGFCGHMGFIFKWNETQIPVSRVWR
jgi:hypothetical protein